MWSKIRKVLLGAFFLATGTTASAESPVLVFGVVPQQAPSKLAALWGPMLQEVSRISGLELRFATAPSIPVFEQRLANGDYDLAYMNPYHFTVFNQTPGYQALAKARDKTIQGILVIRKDNPIAAIEALDGLQIAFPAPAAFAATLLTQSHLNNSQIEYQPKYVSSHDSVYLSVAKGLHAAGGGIKRTLNNLDPAVRDQLRIIWTSVGYTPHAIAVHPRVSIEQQQQVQNALVSLEQQSAGASILASLNIKGWLVAENRDWDDVRQLNIRKINH